MSVDTKTVRRIARLARIRVTDAELPKLQGELNAILQWIEMLGEVDVTDVAPLTSIVDRKLHLRDDEVTDGGHPGDVVANAPVQDDHFYVVPKVVE
jgi:aspartyl-tRNA(Asn)/glutamyl-tRNA(Gln) amidotransferase subunit C